VSFARRTLALEAIGRLAYVAMQEKRYEDAERWLDLHGSV